LVLGISGEAEGLYAFSASLGFSRSAFAIRLLPRDENERYHRIRGIHFLLLASRYSRRWFFGCQGQTKSAARWAPIAHINLRVVLGLIPEIAQLVAPDSSLCAPKGRKADFCASRKPAPRLPSRGWKRLSSHNGTEVPACATRARAGTTMTFPL
jgi:hypothetical protein